MDAFLHYFLLFMIYSFLGWIIETINCSILSKKKILNRGFLFGPYLPIYGSAAVIMILFLNEYKSNAFNLFIMAVTYASLLEYFTSWLMEVLFKARWWDYTNEKFNINGRICLRNCLLFGVLGFLLLYFVNPFIEYLLGMVAGKILSVISIILLIIIIADVIFTIYILSRLNIQVKNIRSDATQDIDKKVKKMLSKYKKSYKRIFKAFPKFKYNSDQANAIIDNIRKRFDEIDVVLQNKKAEIKRIKSEIKLLRFYNKDAEVKEKKDELKKLRRKKIK